MSLASQVNALSTRVGQEIKSVWTALALKAPIASPSLTGTVSTPPMATFQTRSGQYDRRNNVYTPVGCRGLPKFMSSLAKVRTGSSTERATIGLVGHSLLAGYLTNTIGVYDPGSALRKALTQTFGVRAGTGIVPTFNGDTTGVTDDVRYSKTGTWSYLGSAGNILPWAFSNTGPPTLTFTSNTPGTVIDIMVADNFGNFSYTIDGGASVPVTVGGTNAWNIQTVSGLADTTHTVVLSGATLVPVGINVRYPSDLEVHNFGNVGTAASDWAPGAGTWSSSLGTMVTLAPKVAVIMLGHAEIFAGTSAATYKTNMQTIITALKNAGSDILLVGAIPRETFSDAQWLPYREALLDLADTNACLLADPYQAFGSFAGGVTAGLFAGAGDPAHLTNAGSAELVRVISTAFVGDAPAGPFAGGVAGTPSSSMVLRGDNTWSYLQAVETFTFSVTGALTVATGKSRIYLEGSYVIETVRAAVNTAPTGATILVDVNKNGTTIYTTQSARPTIAISGFSATGNSPAVTTFSAGDYITVDVDQIGSTIAGSDLTVTVRLRRTA